MIAAQLVTFFMITLSRLLRTVSRVSMMLASRSRSESVHSLTRSTWS